MKYNSSDKIIAAKIAMIRENVIGRVEYCSETKKMYRFHVGEIIIIIPKKTLKNIMRERLTRSDV
jgi:hypothetical protein